MSKHHASTESLQILKALADDIRLDAARHVASSRKSVSSREIVESCAKRSQLTQPAMSHHFKKLVDAGVLLTSKVGTENYYSYNRVLCKRHGIDIARM